MQAAHPHNQTSGLSDKLQDWFGYMIHTLRTDALSLETNTASDERRRAYETLATGNQLDLAHQARTSSTITFISRMLQEYFNEIHPFYGKVKKIAFNLSEAKILVWAEINDDDWDTEKQLYLLESRLNGKYSEYGFFVSTMVVDSSDGLEVPPHYYSPVLSA